MCLFYNVLRVSAQTVVHSLPALRLFNCTRSVKSLGDELEGISKESGSVCDISQHTLEEMWNPPPLQIPRTAGLQLKLERRSTRIRRSDDRLTATYVPNLPFICNGKVEYI